MTKAKIIDEVVAELRADIEAIVNASGGMKQVIITEIMYDRSRRELCTIHFGKHDEARHIIAAITSVIVTEWEEAIDLPAGYTVHTKSQNGECKTLFINAYKW